MNSRQPAPPPDLPGFTFVELLGSGGFADVFKYTQLGLGRQVAVKVLTSGVGEQDLTAFQAEATVMAQLSNHPSIVSIYQAGVTLDGRPYLVMEFCPPPHLGQRVRQRPLSVAKALEITIQLAGAIETSHRIGILHRDIKPANILFTEFGRPALTDFGISVTTHSGAEGGGIGMSVPWAPPEQLSAGAPMGASGDVYALAATMWTALVGHPPFHVPGGANDPLAMAPRVRSQPVPATGRPDVPESLERVLRTAMAKSPVERFDSAVDLARALQAVQAEQHQAVTSIEVAADRDLGSVVDDEPTPSGTKFSGFISVDPSPAPSAAPPVAPAPARGEVTTDRTVLGVAGPTDEPAAALRATADPYASPSDPAIAGEPGTEPRSRARTLAVVGALAVLAVLVLALQFLGGDDDGDRRSGGPATSAPADPLDDGRTVVPVPVDVAVTPLGGSRIRVTWTNPDPQDGDRYAVKLIDNTQQLDWTFVDRTAAVIRSLPGRECVLVRTIRANGDDSFSADGCPGGAS